MLGERESSLLGGQVVECWRNENIGGLRRGRFDTLPATTLDDDWVSMQTQFAGPDAHVRAVGLLKYLERRYISNLEVHDESEYWDTGDRRKLERDMAAINETLEHLSAAAASGRLGSLAGLSAEEIANRLEGFFPKTGE